MCTDLKKKKKKIIHVTDISVPDKLSKTLHALYVSTPLKLQRYRGYKEVKTIKNFH